MYGKGVLALSKKKRKTNRFKVHGVMDFGDDNRMELMFNSNLDRATVRAVRSGVIQKPYSKSSIFHDDEGAYIIVGAERTEEFVRYAKLYLENFKRVRGMK